MQLCGLTASDDKETEIPTCSSITTNGVVMTRNDE